MKLGNEETLQRIKGGLIVSCQALPEEPLHSSFIMGRMALAASQAGAVGIRANTVADIKEIRNMVDLPIIGIIKKVYDDCPDVYITPTIAEVDALTACGVEIIATDATRRDRPGGETIETFFSKVRAKFPDQLFMADCSNVEEGMEAAALGCRCGSCFHVIWNQEREAAGLDQKMSEDTSTSVKVAVEGLKRLIEADRKAGR